jgi:hypothetical protein
MAVRTTPLMREIAAILAVKVVAIAVIWAAFFGPDTRPAIDRQALARHLELPPAQQKQAQKMRGGAP